MQNKNHFINNYLLTKIAAGAGGFKKAAGGKMAGGYAAGGAAAKKYGKILINLIFKLT